MPEQARAARLSFYAGLALLLLFPAVATPQTTFTVANESQLRAAMAAAAGGDRIVFTTNITLSAGDLPELASSVVIDGAGHTLFLASNARFKALILSTRTGTTSAILDRIVDEGDLFGLKGDRRWSLHKFGEGTLVLSGANQYSGGIFVSEGWLSVAAAANLGTGFVRINGSGNLAITGTDVFTQNLFIFVTGIVSVAAGHVATWTGRVRPSEFAHLWVAGGGTLALTNTDNYLDSVRVFGGSTLLVSDDRVFGPSLFFEGVTLGDAVSSGTLAIDSAIPFFTSRAFTLAAGGGTFDVRGATSATLNGIIFGPGALTKAGTGTLTLTGVNTYTGGTFVIGNGALAISSDTNLGAASGSVTLGDTSSSGTLIFSGGSTFSTLRPFLLGAGGGILDTPAGSSVTLNGSISGSGNVTKLGAGTLTFGGSNSYSGATNVLAGVLRAGASNVFGGTPTVNVAGGATLDLNGFSQMVGSLSGTGAVTLGSATLTTGVDGSSSLFSGVISGSGSLVKAGGGTFTLAGANTYSGGTTVLGGTLAGNTTSLRGNITNNAVVLFDQNIDGTYAGSMSGSGMLAKTGGGNLTLTGANTYTGGTLIEGGSLSGTTASLRGTIVNNASLTIDEPSDTIFSGVLAGSGSVFKTGGGTLSLSGLHSLSGRINVTGGTLVSNGFLGGSVTIAPGATVRASGTIAGSVDVGGSLFAIPPPGSATLQEERGGPANGASPGDPLTSPPYLTIGGNLFASNGSVLGMPIGPGTNPTILVGGRATLAGTQLSFAAELPAGQRSVSFLALTALNGLSMTDATAVTPSLTLVPLLTQDDRSLFVTLLNYQVPLAGEVTTPNAIAVGEAIDRIKMDATGDRAGAIRELVALDDAALDQALEQVAGELHASSVQLAVLESESFTDLIRSQLTARAHDAEEEEADGWGGEKIRWWGQLTGEYASFGPSDGSRGAIGRFGSGAGGMDLRLSNRWLFGAGGGFGAGNMGLRGLSGNTEFRAPRAFGYVGYRPRAFGLRAGGSASHVTYEKTRRMSFAATLPAEFGIGLLTGGIDRQGESEEAGLVNDTWGEYDDSVEVKTYVLDWMVGMRQARFSRGGFSESGAGGLALAAAEQILTLRHTDVKLHLWRKGGKYRPYMETMFRRELTDGSTGMTLQFADEPDSDFTVDGVPVPGNMFAGRAGVTMVTRVGALTFEYAIRKAAGQTGQTAGVRVRFR